MKPDESLEQRVTDTLSYASRHIKHFDAILARFARKFGVDRVNFELFEYGDRFGVAVTDDHKARIAIMFDFRSGVDQADAAIAYVKRWMDGETEFKGVAEGYILSGNEIWARDILAGEVK